jgi:hypothetical protein
MSQSESGNPTPPPSFREVSSAYKDIAAHNKKFGFAAVFTSFLELGTKQQEATEIEDTFGPKATEAEMSADLQVESCFHRNRKHRRHENFHPKPCT